jgi:prepilin-type N-terminal cleavage/methylation domain-containing protein
MRKSTSGFTIVELLIVVVVIAILAAISVVAYTSIQERARDSIRADAMAKIERALELYKTDHGRYPSATANPGYSG